MAALLLAAGTKGKRFALPSSRIMLHQPLGAVTGTSADIALQAQEIAKLKQECARILSTHTGQTIETIIQQTERDLYMSAEEALAYGLIDKIASQTSPITPSKP